MKQAAHQLVVLRHGHSLWNLCNRFTGWNDIPLTEMGLSEAAMAGRLLASMRFDEAHISVLQRTRQTLDALLHAAQHPLIPVFSSWRLNERHYGQLQGMHKADIFQVWGEEQARRWWRGYDVQPPPLDYDDQRHPRFDPLYRGLSSHPSSESLYDCQLRLLPYWYDTLQPRIAAGKRLLMVSHGNTLRALIMHLEQLDAASIETVEIPSATPLIYRFDQNMQLVAKAWLALAVPVP